MKYSDVRIVFIVCSLFFIVQSNSLSAQDVNIRWGEAFGEKNMVSLCSIVGEDANNYYTEKTKYGGASGNNETIFESYSMDHKLIKSGKLNLKTTDGKEGYFMRMYQVQDKFIIFFRFFDPKTKRNTLYASNMDMSGKQSPAVLIDTEPATLYTVYETYSFIVAKDGSNVLVVSDTDHENKSKNKYKYIMLKANTEVLWENQTGLGNAMTDFDIGKKVVDESGNVIMVGFSAKAKPVVFVYDHEKNSSAEISLNLDLDKMSYPRELSFFDNEQGLYLVGFYSEKNGTNQGIIYNKINTQTYKVESSGKGSFEKATISKFLTEKELKSGFTIENSYVLKDIVVKENGTMQIIAENCHKAAWSEKVKMAYGSTSSVKASMAPNGPASTFISTTDSYYNSDIAVIQFNKAGTIDWLVMVPKNQYSENDGGRYASYLHISKGDHLYLVYNDNPKNALPPKKPGEKEIVKEAQLTDIDKATMMIATIDAEGNLKRELYGSPAETGNIAIKTVSSQYMNANKIWTIGFKGNKRMYGFITVQ